MGAKILIIEDKQEDFKMISDSISKYGIEYYPQPPDFRKFAQLLRKFGNQNLESDKNLIKEQIESWGDFDVVLLDITLTQHSTDKSGYILRDEVIEPLLPDAKIYYVTTSQLNEENYINKVDNVYLNDTLYRMVISKLVNSAIDTEQSPAINAQDNGYIKKNIEDMERITSLPSAWEKAIQRERFKLQTPVSFTIDTGIKYIFYAVIATLFVYAVCCLMVVLAKYYTKPIQVAEYVFLIFLPFLIACGFYVFYIKSLSPHILQKNIDQEDFDKASILLKVTKKLFVSSLLSYLFIKLIELLLLEKAEDKEINPISHQFSVSYKTENPFLQLYFVIGFIVILILYYMYIDRDHHKAVK
jgi:CheY-like chemotaxis protein